MSHLSHHSIVSSYMSHMLMKPVFAISDPISQIALFSHRRWIDAYGFVCREKRDCIINLAKTKMQISCTVTVQLICTFVFAFVNSIFSHDVARPVIPYLR